MAKDDFDIDFNFEEEYGFDPNTFMDGEEPDSDLDLNQFSDEELGLGDFGEAETQEVEYSEEDQETEPQEEAEDALPYDPLEGFPRDNEEETEDTYSEEEYDEEAYPEEDYPEEEDDYEAPQEEEDFEDQPEPSGKKPRVKKPKVKKPRVKKAPKPKKPKKEFHTPKFLLKFYDLYFAPLSNKAMMEEPQDPTNPRRRRRKSKAQLFKEFYLPPILVGVCAVLVLSFVVGSVTNLIAEHQAESARQQSHVEESLSAAQQQEQMYDRLMAEAEDLAAGYDYKGAADLLESFGDMSGYPDMSAKHAEYLTIQNSLVEHSDPSLIPNLSFHVLINDMARAKKDTELGGKYNKNFVTTGEFTNILSSLYNNGYVLVDWDSFIAANSSVDGTEMFSVKSIYLPPDKKPIMLTETMVNYFNYMIDSNDDKQPDKDGYGFAYKLVVQNGEIKAAYIDANGNDLVGDYDFVPILETFIKAHPDFVYQGARATLAVTGSEGVFGYRVNTSYINSVGASYQEEQVVRAKEVVQALRDKGYRIACFTYGNVAYKTRTVQQIQQDLQDWNTHITPVLGKVDTIVFAQTSDISDYTGPAFNVLYTQGFRYFVSNLSPTSNDQAWAEVNSTFVRQKRLMVTGNAMAWHTSKFNNLFDCQAILDTGVRGNVPNE